jgi:glutaconyl-CoA/methylmalonyl-CoA decarboxylase subunit gamma
MRRYHIVVKKKEYVIDVQETGEHDFRVMLGDQSFDVTLSSHEDVAEAAITPAMEVSQGLDDEAAIIRPSAVYHPQEPEPTERPISVPIPSLPPTPVLPSDSFHPELVAPMPGTILSIEVKPGDSVKRGQTVLILEAMKMKNAIKSSQDAIVREIVIEPGKTVRFGDVLVKFEEP